MRETDVKYGCLLRGQGAAVFLCGDGLQRGMFWVLGRLGGETAECYDLASRMDVEKLQSGVIWPLGRLEGGCGVL